MDIKLINGDISHEFMFKCMRANIVGMDTETSGLDRDKDKLACVQICIPSIGECVIVRNFDEKPQHLIQLLESSTMKVFHFAPFDLHFLMKTWAMRPRRIECTKLMAKMCDPHCTRFYDPVAQKASHSLRALVYTICGVTLEKKHATSNWFAKRLTKAQLQYAMEDTLYLVTIYGELLKQLINTYKIEDYQDAVRGIPVATKYKLDYQIENLYAYN